MSGESAELGGIGRTVEENVQRVRDAHVDASGCWSSADWTHDFDPPGGKHVWFHGDAPEYCEGGRASCRYCAGAEADAAGAEQLAAECMGHIEAGRWSQAAGAADAAASLESQYGDNPTWGGFARLVEDVCEQALSAESASASGR